MKDPPHAIMVAKGLTERGQKMSEMDGLLVRVKKEQERTALAEGAHLEAAAGRDGVLREAFDAGVSVARLAEVTGLSRRTVYTAIERARHGRALDT